MEVRHKDDCEALHDRVKGGLYGVAVGDALGGTTEFMEPDAVHAAYGYLTEIVGGGVWQLEPGEVTDDTMMTLCVAEGILANPSDPLEAVGDRFIAWYDTKPKDVGNTIRSAIAAYRGNWFDAALAAHERLGQSAGNGSLMRCLPVALAYTETSDIERVSRMQSKMTHADERCADACIVYNRLAAKLLRGEELASAIPKVIAATPYRDVLDWNAPACRPTGFVEDSMRLALHILLTARDFSDVVQRAANGGGDSDTIGAIAGGLAGIHCGYGAMPARYKDAILVKARLDAAAAGLTALRTEAGS